MCIALKYGIWNTQPLEAGAVNALVTGGYPPLPAMVLASRGLTDPKKAQAYLSCDAELYDPFLMTDMDTAVTRVQQAIDRGEKIAGFGDYDVDGITSTCMLTDFLRRRVHLVLPQSAVRLLHPDRHHPGRREASRRKSVSPIEIHTSLREPPGLAITCSFFAVAAKNPLLSTIFSISLLPIRGLFVIIIRK